MKQENIIKLLKELIRNSKRSDRELAKAVNLSQPTVTRLRKLADKYVRSYTIVPEFGKIGYELLAFTFVKARTYEKTKVEENIRLVKEWYKKHPM
jgi:DNA-binding Lrp family transcriptional regulator